MKKILLFASLFLLSLIHLSAQCSFNVIRQDVSCAGTNDGSLEIIIFDGQAPYDIQINNTLYNSNSSTFVVENLAAGSYDITITDANQCQLSTVTTISTSPELNVQIFVQNECTITCIDIFVSGGAPPFTYEWSNGLVGPPNFCDQINPGFYQVTVTDANGCSAVEEFFVDENFRVAEIVVTPISCDSAILSVELPDGDVAISYFWNNGPLTTPTILATATNSYNVEVMGTTGCLYYGGYYYQGMLVSTFATPINCFGGNDGSIDLEVIDGMDNLQYDWIGPNGFSSVTQNISQLIPGDYTVTVTDENSCSAEITTSIIEPEEINIAFDVTQISCYGENNGAVDLTATGGVGGFNYNWLEFFQPWVGSPEDLNDLEPGTYHLTVSDDNNCMASDSVTIVEPDSLIVTIVATAQTCLGNGMATASVEGGTEPFEYAWSNSEDTPEVTNLIAGFYEVTVTDANDCFAIANVTIASPISLTLSSTLTSCNTNDGTATVEILGGAAAPNYEWSNGQTTATAIDLAPDWYSVTVTDTDTGCQVHQNVEVEEDPICFVKICGSVFVDEINPDCQADTETIPAEFVQVLLSDGQITYTNSNGYYEFTTDADNYDVEIAPNPAIFDLLCADPININADTWGNTYCDNDFYLTYSDERDIQLKVNKPRARPGFTQIVTICLMNRGAVPISGVLTFIHPEVQTYLSTNIPEDSYDASTQTLTWNYADIPPGVTWVYKVSLKTPVGTPLGTNLDYEFSAPVVADLTPENNEILCSEEVTGSFDPNDKAVEPAGIGPEGIISMADSLLNYRIRFQNTGTDTAFTVRILDTLDADLNLRSLVPGPSSHPYTASFISDNVVEFLFENILLVDSVANEPESHGFVFYDIYVKPGSPYGTRIENSAGIYFDFNEPVITNTTVNSIQMIVDIEAPIPSAIEMELFPNPTGAQSLLQYTLAESTTVSIQLYDLLGNVIQVLESGTVKNKGVHQLMITDLDAAAGIYIVSIQTSSGNTGSKRLVKM